MANLKAIRKRISSVKSTQKITRAMKMVAGARLNRAQQRIVAMRPYAQQTSEVLSAVVHATQAQGLEVEHPLLSRRPEKTALLLVVTGDRGLCGAFNANINKYAESLWRKKEAEGIRVRFATVGRRGRDYFRRRGASFLSDFEGVWDDLGLGQARRVARTILAPYLKGEVDAIYLIYNEFKSAMTQHVICSPLLPLSLDEAEGHGGGEPSDEPTPEYIFEPDRESIYERLVPMYIEITILRALFDSVAAELGARMTAMDSATKNAEEMIGKLTLQYNRQRQAVITTELIEIIAGSEALAS